MEDQRTTQSAFANDDAILPDGWAEGDDIFDTGAWTGADTHSDGKGNEATRNEQVTDEESDAEESPAIETDAAETDGEQGTDEELPATQGNTEPNKLRFRAKVDHQDVDVELDDSELPSIYEKAQATDRYKQRLEQQKATIAKSKKIAKLLGYKDVDEMLDSSEASFISNEKARYEKDNVHPDIAEDLVTRRVKDIEDSVKDDDDEPETPKGKERDFRPEVASLIKEFPELKGKTLPDEVAKECISSGKPLVDVYKAYLRKQTATENEKLRKENETLKQNAEAAKRAPVKASTGKGGVDSKAEDAFLAGFDEEENLFTNKFRRR